jgi:hypothetical protein
VAKVGVSTTRCETLPGVLSARGKASFYRFYHAKRTIVAEMFLEEDN